MASNLIVMASNLEAMASNLIAMASTPIAMASNIEAMAYNLEAMASILIAMEDWVKVRPRSLQDANHRPAFSVFDLGAKITSSFILKSN